jgi:hypothetical protein
MQHRWQAADPERLGGLVVAARFDEWRAPA